MLFLPCSNQFFKANAEDADELGGFADDTPMTAPADAVASTDADNDEVDLAGAIWATAQPTPTAATTGSPVDQADPEAGTLAAVPAKEAPPELVAMIQQIDDRAVLSAVQGIITQRDQELFAFQEVEAARLMEMIQAAGLEDLMAQRLGIAPKSQGSKGSAKAKGKMKPKYRLPTGETWTGVGMMKREFKAALEQGAKLDDFLITEALEEPAL